MKSILATLFSLVLMATGIGTIVWITSGMLAPANSQPAVVAPPATPPIETPTEAFPKSPDKVYGKPGETYVLPRPEPTEEQKAEAAKAQAEALAAQEAAARAAAEQVAAAQAAAAQAQQPAVPQQLNPPSPGMDLPPPAMDMPPPPTDLPALGNPPSETEAFVATIQNPEGYTYDPTGRRDPFRPFGQSQIVAPIPAPIPIPTPQAGVPPALQPPTPLSPAEPLQQYDLAQLKVVGIVWEVRNPKAMIKDPIGKLHLIRKEAKIGRNNGFVAAIREGEIIVVEPAYGEGGVQTAVTRTMSLIR